MFSSLRNTKISIISNSAKKPIKRYFSGSISRNEFSMENFDYTVRILRDFFNKKGWREVHMQHRPSIMAACEDPWTIVPYTFKGRKWPLPQTNQMWLEHELLTNPDVNGIYTLSTSYRQEPQPMPGRHEMVFPMFEFEGKGNYGDLKKMLNELVFELGLVNKHDIGEIDYNEACSMLNKEQIEARDEETLGTLLGKNVYYINKFPENTSPFWNMKRSLSYSFNIDGKGNGGLMSERVALKTDVIIAGHETIGCAERETDINVMRERFETISGGRYAEKIRSEFGYERVDRELDEFLTLDFFERYGGGIGLHRLINGMRKLGVFRNLPDYSLFI